MNTKDSGGWREIFAPGVIKSMAMSVSGIWGEATAQAQLLTLAMSTVDPAANFIFTLGGTEQISGRFQVTSYEHSGETEGASSFSVSFESDGPIVKELLNLGV